MSLDPNWFYSTLAQSTAAIVGLAGAFLVQRILAQRSDIAQDRRDLRANAQGFLVRAANDRQRAAEAASALTLAIANAERALETGEPFRPTVDEVFSLTHGRGYTAGNENRSVPFMDPQAALPLLRDARDAVQELAEAIPTTLSELGPMLVRRVRLEAPGSPWLDESLSLALDIGIEPANFWDWIPRQRDVARQTWQALDGPPGSTDVATARGLAERLTVLRQRLIPASFWALWWTLLGLLGVGLIAPLTYLSARGGSSKSVLLATFGVLSVTFLGFIAYEMHRLRQAEDLARETF